jgi:hypothetical protein
MAVNIVTVDVNQEIASAPIILQQTGAIISQGATTLTAGTVQLITQRADLTDLLVDAAAITSMTYLSTVVTVTTTAPHGIPMSDVVDVTISGVTPAGYNGTFAATSTGASTFTYSLASNPGAVTVQGLYTLADVAELTAQVNTFFAQGSSTAVYILELGIGTPAQGVTALTAYLLEPVVAMYRYLLPYNWDTETSMQTLALSYNGVTAQVYFHVTTTLGTYTNWNGLKSVVAMFKTPTATSAEFDSATWFWQGLHEDPNASNMMRPMRFRYVFGVTPYLTLTGAQQTAAFTAGVNWIDTGAQGQISQTLIETGKTMDAKPFTYWFAVDWIIEHEDIGLSAAIINGSNTPQNPLIYNQDGINRLQKVAQSIMDNAVSFGLILNGATVSAVPFPTYIAQHPTDYAAGIYNGLACTFVPARGFDAITIYLTASDIPT